MVMNAEIPHYTLLFENVRTLPANRWTFDKIPVKNIGLSLIIEIHVHQVPDRKDDIEFLLLGEKNFAVFERNKKEMENYGGRLGARTPIAEPYEYILDNLVTFDQSFYLPTQRESLYLVLDNGHSSFKEKTVTLRVFEQLPPLGSYEPVKMELSERGWSQVIRHLDNAEADIRDPNKLESCCNSLRVALATTLANVAESYSRGGLEIAEGKSFPIGNVVRSLEKNGVPEDIGGLLRQHWALVSEGLHSEKNKGESRNPRDVNYAYGLILDSIRYLLSLKS